ncbi:hypothetical protein KG088_17150 [Halomonas sp. TRM85114]|uniref:hypothetical protein n=1 Tax=Halomonas jincaotanensis TaxID=2810616 RepID=UPI001BD2BF0E|nr:hypothetical protein [Halomonas jincaotanensis]MBS9405342.1 hypothetical protein [Halomonas jincaotanensis]
MSRPDDAKKAIQSIHRHLDVILDACLQQQGKLYLSEETEKAANALLAHRLAFHLNDEEEEVIVTSALADFIHFITQSHRRRVASGEVGDKWRELDQAVSQYNIAKGKHSATEEEKYHRLVREVVYQLIDTMRQVATRFSEYVYNDFRSISDIEIKIKENEFALSEAEKMNTLFESISYDQLAEMAGADPYLVNLLNKQLAREIDILSREVLDAIHQLKRSLTQLVKKSAEYQRQNRLINAFISHYEDNPDFTPSFPVEDRPVDALMGVEPIAMEGHPDLQDPRQEEKLIELATRAVLKVQSEKEGQEREDSGSKCVKVDVQDHGTLHTSSQEEPEQASAREFFAYLSLALEAKEEVSGRWFYEFLDIDTTMEIWLLTLMNQFYEMDKDETEAFLMRYVTEPVTGYSGNHLLRDLAFRKRVEAKAA